MTTNFLDRVINKALGEMLLERGFVNEAQLDEGLERSKAEGKRLGETLVALGYVNREMLNHVLGEQYGVRPLDLHPSMLDERLVRRFPLDLLQTHQMLPLIEMADELVIVTGDPNNSTGLKELACLAPEFRISAQLADSRQIRHCLDSLASARPRAYTSSHGIPTECPIEPAVPQPGERSFATWLVGNAVQQPAYDILLRVQGEECQVARDLHDEGRLEVLHNFATSFYPSVRDALLAQCHTIEFTREQAARFATPLRFGGNIYDLLVVTPNLPGQAHLRLRALLRLSAHAPMPDAAHWRLKPGELSFVKYSSLEVLQDILAQIAQSRHEQNLLIVQQNVRCTLDGVATVPAPYTDVVEASQAAGASVVVFDHVPASHTVHRLMRSGPHPPAVLIASWQDAQGHVSPDVQEWQSYYNAKLLEANRSSNLTTAAGGF